MAHRSRARGQDIGLASVSVGLEIRQKREGGAQADNSRALGSAGAALYSLGSCGWHPCSFLWQLRQTVMPHSGRL